MNPFESSDTARFHELDAEYEILGELGRGGTSVVYRARERELGRDVAIKVVRSTHVTDTEAVARLAREAKLVAALRHPNVVPLLSVRHLSDGLALIMQHVPGRTLKRAIRDQGPLPVAMVEHVLREIGSALDYAHKRHGIVHRDIKPENIYLDEEVGRALLSDFGIARTTEGDSTLTLVGTALGTPAYMSPEQIDGTALDGRSDLYSLGLVAYEMLTAQQPWAGHNLYTIIYKQKHEELPPISEFRKDVPVYLLRAIDALLRKDASERCADAAEFLAQLPSGGSAAISFPAPVVPTPAAARVIDDDAPTLRYQRPALSEEPPAPPVLPEPAAPAPPAEPAIAAVAATAGPVLVDEPQVEAPAVAPVLELPTVRPNWRRAPSARGRGGLTAGDAFAHPEIAVDAPAPESVPAAPPANLVRRRHTRMIAGLTLFLVMSASATVVAMINRRSRKADAEPLVTNPVLSQVQPNENAEAAWLTKASDSAPADTMVQPPTTEEKKAQTEHPPGRKEPSAPIPVPEVALPSLTGASIGHPMSPADFASAGVIPTVAESTVTRTPSFAPRTVEPQLKNRDMVQRALADNYPRTLRERGVSGSVRLWVLVDSIGRVLRSEIQQSSGNQTLDRAAARVVSVMEFTPAMNRDRKVSVWIQIPIHFQAHAQ